MSFQRNKDPFDSIGIGQKTQIKNWFEKYIPTLPYKINDDLSIEIDEDFYFHDLTLLDKNMQLPDNLIIKGSLDLESVKISKLPNNLKIQSFLDISHTNISKLPDDIEVKNIIVINYNLNFTEFPSNINFINNGSLDISYSSITELPDNLIIKGSLDLEGTNISKLPNNLTIEGYLDIKDTKITELPKKLYVKRLHIQNMSREFYENIIENKKLYENITFMPSINCIENEFSKK